MLSVAKFCLFVGALVALLVVVVIPAVAGPLISATLREGGLAGDDLQVEVDLLGGSILTGRASAVHVQADDVVLSRAAIGRVDVTLHGVAISDRSFESISGTLHDVRLRDRTGPEFVVESVTVDGPAGAAVARGRMN